MMATTSQSPVAASSPASNSIGTSSIGTVMNGNAGTPKHVGAFDMPRTNLRGLNKPRCIKCGNVARSRCPFQSCKSCCYKAQNPCHVHVLKQANSVPEKPSPSAPPLDQPSINETANGASWRLNCLRQIPYNALNELRARKQISKKDVGSINKWRFMKIKEHLDMNAEVENEAFQRYMQNVTLLKEVFAVSSEPEVMESSTSEMINAGNESEMSLSELKYKLMSDSVKEGIRRDRISNVIAQKLKKLNEYEDSLSVHSADHDMSSLSVVKQRFEGMTAVSELHNKMNKARSEDDLKLCSEWISRLPNLSSCSYLTELQAEVQELNAHPVLPYSFPSIFEKKDINSDILQKIDAEFSTIDGITPL